MTDDERDLLRHLYIKADARARMNGCALYKACIALGKLTGESPEELEQVFISQTRTEWNAINSGSHVNQV